MTNPDASGNYYIELPGGHYDIVTSLPSYTICNENNIHLQAQTTTIIDFNLN